MSDTIGISPAFTPPPSYFADTLADAERLLQYAAESGLKVDDVTRDSVLHARAVSSIGWTEEAAANLITAFSTLAALTKPVTADSIKACCGKSASAVRSYLKISIWLAVFIVPISVASFLVSAISTTIHNEILQANELAVKLNTQTRSSVAPQANGILAPAQPAPQSKFVPCSVSDAAPTPYTLPAGVNEGDVISELQQYATLIRSIDARARQLNALVFWTEGDPCGGIRKNAAALHQVFELPVGIPNLVQAANDRTAVYQEVRYFAQSLLDDTSSYYGAITSCILPALYALLGTCAYLLRTFEQQMSARTFIPSEANSARFLIAGIGGGVVGLFHSFTITQVASVPPLAIAFLVGYAVDVFFAFLEGLLQSFTRNTTPPPSGAKAGPQ